MKIMGKILQLKIQLEGVKPTVWRRFLVPDSVTFSRLHDVTQKVMGWKNYHLYEFEAGNARISVPNEDLEDIIDSKKIALSEIMKVERQKIRYTYDFGDSWEHIITVEKIMEKTDESSAVCVAGERACPPEDCGGIYGYEELLEIKKNKNHKHYKEMIVEWLGEDFDPEKFELEEVNKELQGRRKKVLR